MKKINKKPFEDLTDKQFSRWTVTSYVGYEKRHLWNVLCDCGNTGVVGDYQLKKGKSKSCGCFARDENRRNNLTHGESASGKRSPELRAFNLAKNQCTNISHANYPKFGAIGIEFRFESIEHFLETVGRRPGEKYVLSRVDVCGHYEPGNTLWTKNKNRIKNG